MIFKKLTLEDINRRYQKKVEKAKKKRNKEIFKKEKSIFFCPTCGEPLNLYGSVEHFKSDENGNPSYTYRCTVCNHYSKWISEVLSMNGLLLLKKD